MLMMMMMMLMSSSTADFIVVQPGPIVGINEAIAVAKHGDNIDLLPGNYTDCSTPVLLNKMVTIRGPGAIIDCDFSGTAIETRLGGNNSTIMSIQIQNADHALYHAVGTAVSLYNVTINNCINGIQIESGAIKIESCQIRQCTNRVIYAVNGAKVDVINSYLYENRVEYGGAVYASGSNTLVIVNNTRFIDNIASSSGGAMVVTTGARAVLYRVIASRNKAVQQHGGGAAIVNASAIIESCYFTNNSAGGDGGGIYMSHDAVVSIVKTSMSENDHYGLYNDGAKELNVDDTCSLCGNSLGQVFGDITDGTPRLCGTITTVIHNNPLNDTLYPGMQVQLNGHDLFVDGADYVKHAIIGDDVIPINSAILPITITLPPRSSLYYGPIVVMSALERRSETYEDFEFEYPWSDCREFVVIGPEPSRGTNLPVIFKVDASCPLNNVMCYFGPVSVYAFHVETGIITCVPPTSLGSVPRNLDIDIQLTTDDMSFNLTTPMNFDYYPLPDIHYTIPDVGIHNVTTITICGSNIIHYPWAKPSCIFDQQDRVEARFVNDSCLECTYMSYDDCTMHYMDPVEISLYDDQYTLENIEIVHVCPLSKTSDSVIMPDTVKLLESKTITVTGNGFFNGKYQWCKFVPLDGMDPIRYSRGHATDPYTCECKAPPSTYINTANVYITNDGGQHYVLFGQLNYVGDDSVPFFSTPNGIIIILCIIILLIGSIGGVYIVLQRRNMLPKVFSTNADGGDVAVTVRDVVDVFMK